MKDVLRTWQVRGERLKADITNKNCLQASLLEASLAVGGRLVNLDSVFSDPKINPTELLNLVKAGSSVLGLEIVRVSIDEGLVKNFKIPSELSDRVELLTGIDGVKRPNIRGLIYKSRDNNGYSTHVECDDDSRRSSRRLAALRVSGCATYFIIELKKKD